MQGKEAPQIIPLERPREVDNCGCLVCILTYSVFRDDIAEHF